MNEEPSDTTLAFIWNLGQFADAASEATSFPIENHRTRHRQAEAKARKHVRRLMALAGLSANDPDARQAIIDLCGAPPASKAECR